MARRPRAPAAYGEDFSFVSPLVKYLLFFFNMLFWVSLGGSWGHLGGRAPPGGLSGLPAAEEGCPRMPGSRRAW